MHQSNSWPQLYQNDQINTLQTPPRRLNAFTEFRKQVTSDFKDLVYWFIVYILPILLIFATCFIFFLILSPFIYNIISWLLIPPKILIYPINFNYYPNAIIPNYNCLDHPYNFQHFNTIRPSNSLNIPHNQPQAPPHQKSKLFETESSEPSNLNKHFPSFYNDSIRDPICEIKTQEENYFKPNDFTLFHNNPQNDNLLPQVEYYPYDPKTKSTFPFKLDINKQYPSNEYYYNSKEIPFAEAHPRFNNRTWEYQTGHKHIYKQQKKPNFILSSISWLFKSRKNSNMSNQLLYNFNLDIFIQFSYPRTHHNYYTTPVMFKLDLVSSDQQVVVSTIKPFVNKEPNDFIKKIRTFFLTLPILLSLIDDTSSERIRLVENFPASMLLVKNSIYDKVQIESASLYMFPPIHLSDASLVFELELRGFRWYMREYPRTCLLLFNLFFISTMGTFTSLSLTFIFFYIIFRRRNPIY